MAAIPERSMSARKPGTGQAARAKRPLAPAARYELGSSIRSLTSARPRTTVCALTGEEDRAAMRSAPALLFGLGPVGLGLVGLGLVKLVTVRR